MRKSPPKKKLSNEGLPRKIKKLERKDTSATVGQKTLSPLKSIAYRDQERSISPTQKGHFNKSPHKFSLPPIAKNGRFSPEPPYEENKISSGRQLRSSIEKNNKIRSISSLAPPDSGKISAVKLPPHPKSPEIPPRRSLKGVPTKFGRAGKNIIHLEPSAIEKGQRAEELNQDLTDIKRIESTRSFSPNKRQYDSLRSQNLTQVGNSNAGAIRPIPTALIDASRNQVSRGIIKTRKTTERLPMNGFKVSITSTRTQKFNSSKSNKLSERMVEKLGIKEEGKVYFYRQ